MTRFADVESLAVQYLNAALDAPVSTRVPAPRPDVFVRVMVTGGSRLNVLFDQPVLTVEAWSTSSWEARDLAGQCRALISAATHDDGFTEADYDSSTPVNLPDESGQARYTFTVPVNVPGEET